MSIKHFETGPFIPGDNVSRIFYDGEEITPDKAAEICQEILKRIEEDKKTETNE